MAVTRKIGLGLLALALSGTVLADASRGATLFESRCAVCHSLDTNRVGPRLGGVVGRPAASIAGFQYSAALQHSGIVWNAALIQRWLTNPEALVPGQAMNIRVDDAQDRSDLVAWLATQSASPK